MDSRVASLWPVLIVAAACAPQASTESGDPTMLTAEERRGLLSARDSVWQAWFGGDEPGLRRLVPESVTAINAGDTAWYDLEGVIGTARDFVSGGGHLVSLTFPRTEIQVFGSVVILYSRYRMEYDFGGRRQVGEGRATEIFVRRGGGWVNPGWHLDSGS